MYFNVLVRSFPSGGNLRVFSTRGRILPLESRIVTIFPKFWRKWRSWLLLNDHTKISVKDIFKISLLVKFKKFICNVEAGKGAIFDLI